MAHYYTDNRNLESNIHDVELRFKDHTILFKSDNGVFSKDKVDYGSRVLLNAIEIDSEKSLLDVGCGYGTLGLSLKKVYACLECVEMVDVNDRAIELCQMSAKANSLDNVKIHKSFVYENVKGQFDLIVSNPPIRAGKKVVFDILEGAYQHLNVGGSLYIVIQKKQGAPSSQKKMEEVFGNCQIVLKDKGYYVLKSVK